MEAKLPYVGLAHKWQYINMLLFLMAIQQKPQAVYKSNYDYQNGMQNSYMSQSVNSTKCVTFPDLPLNYESYTISQQIAMFQEWAKRWQHWFKLLRKGYS